MSHVSGLQGFSEPSPYEAAFLDHEEVESPFRVVHRTSRSIDLSSPMAACLARIASTMTRENVLHFGGIYGFLSHIRVSAPRLVDKMMSGLEGGIAMYEGFLHVGLRLPFHPFIHKFLDRY